MRFVPPLTPAEYEALKESIRINGQLNPIIVNPEGYILDGVHRYRACMELGVEPKYIIEKFDDPLEEKKFVIESNLMRRQLTKFQRIEIALPLIEIERELAEKRRLSALKKGDDLPDRQNFAYRGKALEIVAKKIGISHETVRQALWLMEHASKEELDKLRRGEKSIHRLYMEVKSRTEKNRPKHCFTGFLAEVLQSAQSIRNSTIVIRRYGNIRNSIIMADNCLLEEWEKISREIAKQAGLDEEKAPSILLESTIRKTIEKMKKARVKILGRKNRPTSKPAENANKQRAASS